MRMFARMAAAAAGAVAVALVLSMLPLQLRQHPAPAGEVKVFRHQQPAALTDRNLADELAALKLNAEITHVEWSQDILTVDLEVPQTMPDDTYIYRDLYRLSVFGFHDVLNVKRLLVRVFTAGSSAAPGGMRVLLAMDARAGEDGGGGAPPATDGKQLKRYLEARYYLAYTALWRRMFASS